ncbi:hypothetical protein R6Q59_019492 [Mikania micrantha]
MVRRLQATAIVVLTIRSSRLQATAIDDFNLGLIRFPVTWNIEFRLQFQSILGQSGMQLTIRFSALELKTDLSNSKINDDLAQITAYVDYFGQFTSEQFPEDIAELVRNRYPTSEKRLFDDVLAMFVLHHPEHGHAVILPIISCIIDGTMEYERSTPPFASFILLICPSADNEYSEQWALACGEILRILTHYNRPIFKVEHPHAEAESSSGSQASTSNSTDGEYSSQSLHHERKPLRPLSPWITDLLLAAPLGIRSDYFRWCGGVMGKYAAGELKPPSVGDLCLSLRLVLEK